MEPAPVPLLGAVEVQKDAGSTTWYCGRIVETARDAVVVSFDAGGEAWKRKKFPLTSVRKPPKLSPVDLEKFSPRIGDEVELRIAATEHSPAAWALAVVKNVKNNSFYFVKCASPALGSGEPIVEKDMLRPVSGGSLPSTVIKQETFDVSPELHLWMTTADASGCFSHIETQSGLLCIQKFETQLVLLGEAKCIQLAKRLLEVHVKHQAEIQKFQDMREKRLRALETKRSRIQGNGYKHSLEVKVPASYIKRIIGKGGESIKGVEEKYSVSVRIVEEDYPHGEELERTVRIFGNCPQQLERAKAEVEFVEESMAVEPEQYFWILGKRGSNIQAIRDSCNLVYASLHRDSQHVRVCGTRQAVQEALAMLESHIMYFPVVQQMDEEMEQMLCQLEDHGDWNARRDWAWYRDDEQYDSWENGGWSGQSGWSDWKDWKGVTPKDDKGGGWGKGAGKAWWQQEEEHWEEEHWEEKPAKEKGRGKGTGGKSGGGWEEEHWEEPPAKEKGRGKGAGGKSGGGWTYQPKEKTQDKKPEAEQDAHEAPGGRRAGQGATRGAGGAGRREVGAPPERPALERRIGKNGPRI